MKVAVVGLGYWGPYLVRNFTGCEGVTEVGCFDQDTDRMRQMQRRFPQVRLFDSFAQVLKSDYDAVDVIPVSDPNAPTMSQKVVQYQAVMQLAQGAPQIYDLKFLHRQMLEVLGIKNAEKLVPIQDDMVPKDPVTENQDILTMKPVKAFIEQNHEAHIQTHHQGVLDGIRRVDDCIAGRGSGARAVSAWRQPAQTIPWKVQP